MSLHVNLTLMPLKPGDASNAVVTLRAVPTPAPIGSCRAPAICLSHSLPSGVNLAIRVIHHRPIGGQFGDAMPAHDFHPTDDPTMDVFHGNPSLPRFSGDDAMDAPPVTSRPIVAWDG